VFCLWLSLVRVTLYNVLAGTQTAFVSNIVYCFNHRQIHHRRRNSIVSFANHPNCRSSDYRFLDKHRLKMAVDKSVSIYEFAYHAPKKKHEFRRVIMASGNGRPNGPVAIAVHPSPISSWITHSTSCHLVFKSPIGVVAARFSCRVFRHKISVKRRLFLSCLLMYYNYVVHSRARRLSLKRFLIQSRFSQATQCLSTHGVCLIEGQ